MTNAELIAKIKAEFKRLKNDWASLDDELTDAMVAEYDHLLDFLTTLESEKPMNQGGQIGSYNIVPYIDDKIAKLQDMWREEKVSFDWDDLKDMIEDVARHFAKWGAEHLATSGKTLEIKPGDEVTINGHKIVYDKDKGYVTIAKSEESVPKDLEEAAWGYASKECEKEAFIVGANWQKQHDAELIEIAYNDGITIGMTKQKEQMMKEAVDMTLCNLYFGNHLEKVLAFGNRTPNGKTIRIIIVKEDEK